MTQPDDQEFVYQFPLYAIVRAEDSCIGLESYKDGHKIVNIFTEFDHAARMLEYWVEPGEIVLFDSFETFRESCRNWMEYGAMHLAFDPECHGAFISTLTQFVAQENS
jgi:hypothetical protein